jgi:uncharacterized protein
VANWDEVCEIVAALPGTELDTGSDNPAWRVNGKVLVRRNPRMRVPHEEEIRGRRGELIAIRTEPGERAALLQEAPETFFITPHWATSPSVLAWLDDVDPGQLYELLAEAWLARAPKRLVRDWQRQSAGSPASAPEIRELQTPRGLARVYVHMVAEPVGAVVLGHGAGGRVNAPDLMAAAEAAQAARFAAVLIEQPYRVAGRRASAPASQLDEAWKAVLVSLREGELRGLPLIVGGRSAGARVACRTAAESGALAVLCLAFPLSPPRRSASPGRSTPTREDELEQVSVPMLVVQGATDQFGVPDPSETRTVVTVRGNHSLTSDLDGVGAAVRDWLPGVISSGSRRRRSRASAR